MKIRPFSDEKVRTFLLMRWILVMRNIFVPLIPPSSGSFGNRKGAIEVQLDENLPAPDH